MKSGKDRHAPGTILLCLLCCLCAAPGAAQQDADEEQASVAELIRRMAVDDYAGRASCEKLIEIGKPAVPELAEATKHETPRVRYWSIAALAGIGDDRALPAIKAALKDPDGLVRAVAVWHSARWFDRKDVRESVLALLGDKDKFVRGWVVRLIAHKKHKDALPRVLAMLRDRDERVRYDALHAAVSLQGPDAVDTLKKTLDSDRSALVRECAVRCTTIIEPRTPRTAEVLIAALADQDEEVRGLAAKLLRKGFDQFFHFKPMGTVGDREKAVGKWQTWYRENRDRLVWDEQRRVFAIPTQKPEPQPAEPK